MSTVHTLVGLSLAASLGMGCTDQGDRILYIVQNNEPGENCVISSDVSAVFIPSGMIDLGSVQGYSFTPVIQSYATVNSGQSDVARTVLVRGARVDVTFADKTLFTDEEINGTDGLRARKLTHFETLFSGSVAPGGTIGVKYDLLPSGLISEIRDHLGDRGETLVLTNSVVYGTMNGGEVESQDFPFAITAVQEGGLENHVGACADLPAGFEADKGGVCNTYQDRPIDCCDGAMGQLICPAAPPA